MEENFVEKEKASRNHNNLEEIKNYDIYTCTFILLITAMYCIIKVTLATLIYLFKTFKIEKYY